MSEPKIKKYVEKQVEFGNPPPGPIPDGEMWLFMLKDGRIEAVDFNCPCGCGNSCYTPVKIPPAERITDHEWWYEPGPTLKPSIRYLNGCKSHFNITNGDVEWHQDSGK